MKMEVPQVDLPLEVLAWTKVTEDILNIYKQSCRLQACIFAADHSSFREYFRVSEGVFCLIVSCQL